jgi:uncharacterized protein (DUF1697 family)
MARPIARAATIAVEMPRGKGAGRSKTYVAFVRGINLGSHHKVSMQDLRALVEALGAEDVATYVQSGNVIFRSGDGPRKLIDAIEMRINRDLGLSVTVLLRTQAELANVLAGNPFNTQGKEPTTLHVTFLANKPSGARVRTLDPKRSQPDQFRLIGREIYLHCPNGYGRSKLTNAYFEQKLGVVATTRNWRTVTKLAELASG